MSRKHVLNSGEYNDPNSHYNALPSQDREQQREAARKRMERIRRLAPQVPNRPWTKIEMRDVFIGKLSLLDLAIALGRNYNDVAKTSQELTRAYAEDPKVLLAFLEVTHVEEHNRRRREREELKVCDECFTSPHQISCSKAE